MQSPNKKEEWFHESNQPLLTVARDLVGALQEGDLHDVILISSLSDDNGEEEDGIPACRFVLAARSKVLKRMLYGNFCEARLDRVELAYDTTILQAIADYCEQNTLQQQQKTETDVRWLVQLSAAADFLELPGLLELADRQARHVWTEYPALACAAFDEASMETPLSRMARHMMENRPYATLLNHTETSGGGVTCLSADRLLHLMQNKDLRVGEIFLFHCIRQWFEHASVHHYEAAMDVAYTAAKYVQWEQIPPTQLLSTVKEAPFVSKEQVFDAVSKQAVQAWQEGGLTVQAPRGGRTGMDRVLVEGAGTIEANGVYYRIDGLANGELYSKRETACGQQDVYTLSCRRVVTEGDYLDCRIFCSKVLTHRAVLTIQTMHQQSGTTPTAQDPSFQPVMQILSEYVDSGTSSNDNSNNGCHQGPQLWLSDGEFYLPATLAQGRLETLDERSVHRENPIVQVFDFVPYELHDGAVAMHIHKLSVVNSSAAGQHVFGSPTRLSAAGATTGTESLDDGAGGLKTLYTCTHPVTEKCTKVPRSGWKLAGHGQEPSPSCTWLPAVVVPRVPSHRPEESPRNVASSVTPPTETTGGSNTTLDGTATEMTT